MEETKITEQPLKVRQERYMSNTYLFLGFLRNKIKYNNNYITLFAGPTGSGKSYGALSLAMMLDPEFDETRVVFSPREFVEMVDKLINEGKKGAVIVLDEAGTEGLSSRDWHSSGNKSINSLLQTFRSNNLILILTVPYYSFIDSRARKLCDSVIEFHPKNVHKRDKIAVASIKGIVPSQHTDKILMPFPKFKTKSGIIRMKTLAFPLVPRWLINAYELKKAAFNKHIRKKAEFEIKPDEHDFDGVTLTKKQFDFVKMYEEQGLTSDEIAKQLNTTKGTISSYKRGAEKKLKRKLVRKGNEPPVKMNGAVESSKSPPIFF